MKTICVTGYKASELGVFSQKHEAVSFIKAALKKRFLELYDNGLEWIIISGQLGVELWAAEVVYELQDEYDAELKVAVITPFLAQEKNWSDTNKEFYESILIRADYVNSVTQKEYTSPQQFRLKNQFFVDKSDGMLLLYDEEKEGSPQYILQIAKKKAETNKYPIYFVTFTDLQLIVEELHNDWNE